MKNVLLCTFLCTRNSSGRQVTLGPTSPYNLFIYAITDWSKMVTDSLTGCQNIVAISSLVK